VVFVAVLIGVLALAGLAVWALRRRGSDEMHSVAGYQHRLERLEEVRRRQMGSVRVVRGSSHAQGSPPPPVVGESGRLEISSSTSSRRVFDDTGQLPATPERPPRPAPYRRRRDLSIARMSHRPRRLGAPIAAAVAVIVLVTGLAIAGAHSRGHPTATTTTIAHHSGTTGTTAPRQTTTTTTVPRTFTASSTNGNVATYALPFASYTLTFTASSNGGCYIQITDASGNVPYAQVLDAGATEQLVLSGPSKVTLGAPGYVTVQVDRTPVTLPTPLPAPLDIDFNGPAPAGSTSSTTSTT